MWRNWCEESSAGKFVTYSSEMVFKKEVPYACAILGACKPVTFATLQLLKSFSFNTHS